jgi:hypothetical protein
MAQSCFLPLLMSSSWGSGEGLSFTGEVLGPTGGFVGALNGMGGGGGGGGCDGCEGRVGCCSIRAWILLLPSALKWDRHSIRQAKTNMTRWPSIWKSLQKPCSFQTPAKYWYLSFYHENSLNTYDLTALQSHPVQPRCGDGKICRIQHDYKNHFTRKWLPDVYVIWSYNHERMSCRTN